MSLQKRSSPASPPPQPTQDLKQRVINCLNKLADRDTLALATTELEFMARSLTTQDSFSQFLNCIHNTDSTAKSPVRKQCVNLLSVLSRHHGDSLSPHLSKMISTVTRRLRDQDSAVRSACVSAISAMSSNITAPPFSVVSKPLMEMLFSEQDYNAQIGAAMCLAAAIEAAEDAEVERLTKALPKMAKLVKREGFKAKAAVLGVIGSVVGVGGAGNKGVLDWLVPFLVEFLSSEDWMARKAAAEGLQRVAEAVEKDLGKEYKKTCLNVLESRRFDKVKGVRETMNHTLELWKEVPSDSEEVSAPSPARSVSSSSSSIDNGSIGCCPPVMKSSQDIGFKTPRTKKPVSTSRSTPSKCSAVTAARKESPFKSNDRSLRRVPMISRQDHKKPSDWKIEIVVPQLPSLKAGCGGHLKDSDSTVLRLGEKGENGNCRPETKRVLFGKGLNEKVHIFGGSKSGSRVVPFPDDKSLDVVVSNDTEEVYDNSKDVEDLSLIREQLLQIENQQSNLFELLQRFIGSSQSGIDSLEARVHGLEMAVEELSYDVAASSGRISNTDSAENTCCKLPGTEFLSPTFWRRTESRFSNSRFSSGSTHSMNYVCNTPDRNASAETPKSDGQKFQHQNRSGIFPKPLADSPYDVRGSPGFYRSATPRNIIQDGDRIKFCDTSRIHTASSATCTAPV